MYSALSTPNTTTEVPLGKTPNPKLLPGRRSINGCPLLQVCVHGVCVYGVCVFTVCVCVRFGWVNVEHELWVWFTILGRMSRHTHTHIYIYFIEKQTAILILNKHCKSDWWENISCIKVCSNSGLWCLFQRVYDKHRKSIFLRLLSIYHITSVCLFHMPWKLFFTVLCIE